MRRRGTGQKQAGVTGPGHSGSPAAPAYLPTQVSAHFHQHSPAYSRRRGLWLQINSCSRCIWEIPKPQRTTHTQTPNTAPLEGEHRWLLASPPPAGGDKDARTRLHMACAHCPEPALHRTSGRSTASDLVTHPPSRPTQNPPEQGSWATTGSCEAGTHLPHCHPPSACLPPSGGPQAPSSTGLWSVKP